MSVAADVRLHDDVATRWRLELQSPSYPGYCCGAIGRSGASRSPLTCGRFFRTAWTHNFRIRLATFCRSGCLLFSSSAFCGDCAICLLGGLVMDLKGRTDCVSSGFL